MNLLVGILLLLPFVLGRKHDIVRQTQYGWVQGEVRKSRSFDSTAEYYYFANVPYARPPLGSLRFQEPLPPIPWTGIKNVTGTKTTCAQLDNISAGPNPMGSEDCLYLEIALPKRPKLRSKLPVMVWIHGGTFIFSGVNDTGPDYLMDEPVVLVSVDYRQNVFGFLSTLDENAKGNAGLKDQVLALKWIQNNIQFFGGDPNKVTIFGCSAGGSSVQLHMLSPRSRGLFHRAITQSGTPLNMWSFHRNPLEMTKRLAKGFNIHTNNTKKIVEELQVIPFGDLLRMLRNEEIIGPHILYDSPPFGPSLEAPSDDAFLTDLALVLLEKGQIASVPYMIGYTTEEGSFPYEYIEQNIYDLKMYDKNPTFIIPSSMNIGTNSECISYSINAIRNFYFNNSSFSNKNKWIDYMTQNMFVRGILKSTELICEKSSIPLYFYRYSFQGIKTHTNTGKSGHYSEIHYLLYPLFGGWTTEESPSDTANRKRLIRLWVNFAYHGKPIPRPDGLLQYAIWPTFCGNGVYIDLGENLTLHRLRNDSHIQFWDDLFGQCGNPPYYTY
ncbi:hypothetical protein FQA39_LY15932 [Lamprigera yunnana]|nr:hypothetical protein FQA39_LY15932 [Lamprigera yunnana]